MLSFDEILPGTTSGFKKKSYTSCCWSAKTLKLLLPPLTAKIRLSKRNTDASRHITKRTKKQTKKLSSIDIYIIKISCFLFDQPYLI